MRDTFSKKLVELVKADPHVYLLSGDHGYALFDALRKERPERFLNAGVAEQNMVGVGAGLSKVGLYPIMYGLSAFVPMRVLEQIKIDFCYENIPGLFIGDGAGVVYSHLGSSHQCTEDIAALRALPHLSILSPADKIELELCFDWAIKQKGPVYLRMGKSDLGDVHKSVPEFSAEEPLPIVQKGHLYAICTTGSMVKPCLDLIEDGKIEADLYSVPVLKNASRPSGLQSLKKYQKIVTVEEHSVFGGLGDIVASVMIQAENPGLLKKIGIEDRFSERCGTYSYLMKEHGLHTDDVEKKVRTFFKPS